MFRLHDRVHPIKLLLGVREKLGVHFIDSSHSRQEVIKNMIEKAEQHYFDGFFLNLRDTYLHSFYFEEFVKGLNRAIDEHATKKNRPRFMTVLAVNSRNAFFANRRMSAYADKFDQFYLKGDEPLSSESENSAILVDPIYTGPYIQIEDVIHNTADMLTIDGIPPEKIIIGLTAYARGYNLVDMNQTTHNAPVYEVARLPNSSSTDGRFPYQEICHLPGAQNLKYWKKSSALSFVEDDGNW
jgi:hypothetical protein